MSEQTCILCVDDERNVLRALERIFLDDDYEILAACSGEEGLTLLDETPQVQVVISDYRMPGMNGVDFLREVFSRRPDTIRIVLSGYADTAAVVAAINEGKIYKFIPKPWNDDDLRQTVAKALETFAIHRRNDQLAEELRQKNEELCRLNGTLEHEVQLRTAQVVAQNAALVQARKVLEQVPMGIVAVGDDGTVLQMNRSARLMLLPQKGDEALGLSMRDTLPGEVCDLVEEVTLRQSAAKMVRVNGVEFAVQGQTMEDAGEGVMLVVSRPTFPSVG